MHISNQGYYRFPTISGEEIVFVCESDLWSVPASGGRAGRLTSGMGICRNPVLSPDGSLLAFACDREGSFEVFVMPAGGGLPRRMTFFGTGSVPICWTRDGSAIIFASDFTSPFSRSQWLWRVPSDGGQARRLSTGPAKTAAYGADGRMIIGRNTSDPARWKRYRGGTVGDIWISESGEKGFRRLLDLDSNLGSPMILGTRAFFISDHEGIGNIYSCTFDGTEIRRHTDSSEFYARNASSDGTRIVYHSGGDIRILDPASGSDDRVGIEFTSVKPGMARKFVEASEYLESYEMHPQGHSMCAVARGKAFAMPLWEGAPRPVGRRPELRYRHARWLPDGKRMVLFSDDGGDETIEVHDGTLTGESMKITGLDTGMPVYVHVNPVRDEIAFANHRHELMVVDLSAKTARVVDRSDFDRIHGIDYSPDGRYIAYGFPVGIGRCGIRIADTQDWSVREVSRPLAMDTQPVFDPEGKYLYFLSRRQFNPVHDSFYFDLNFPRGEVPCLVTLAADCPNPFVPVPRPPGGTDDDDEDEDGKEGSKGKSEGESDESEPPQPVKIDFDGIADRMLAFPVPEGTYGQIAALRGKVIYTRYPIEGSLDEEWFDDEPPANALLMYFDLVKLSEDLHVEGLTGFTVSGDRKSLLYRVGNRLRAVKASEKPEAAEAGCPKAGRESGWVDLDRIRVEVRPYDEFSQMFREAWKLQREHFWTKDMSGIDWQGVYDRYFPLVARISEKAELDDLLWETQGELGTSHAYVQGGDLGYCSGYVQGTLGADLEFDSDLGLWKITFLPRGDSWDSAARSPLAEPGLCIAEGDYIVAIDGVKPDGKVTPWMLLSDKGGESANLAVMDRAGSIREVTVKVLEDEEKLRYRNWVESNRDAVHRKSGGRVGYLHVPDMGPEGYAEFHRYYLSEFDRQGLIVDVRYNGGGNVSELLLEKLSRRRIGYDVQRWGREQPYPSHSVGGPIVTLTNEQAGSDGDIFCHSFKLLGLGTLVGKRTWGGVIGINPRHPLVDGTVTTQPEFSFWFSDVGWGVENRGTDPDVMVEISPDEYAAGQDPQLDTALALILEQIEKNPPVMPDFGPRPRLAAPRLPVE